MSLKDSVNGILNTSIDDVQIKELVTGLKELEKFFNENYEEGSDFSMTFFNRFQKLTAQFGFYDSNEEALISELYNLAEYENLATYLVTTGREVTGSYDYCDWVYEQMLQSFQED